MTLTAEPARRGFIVPKRVEPAEIAMGDESPAQAAEVTVESVLPCAAIPAPPEPAPLPPRIEDAAISRPAPQPAELPPAGPESSRVAAETGPISAAAARRDAGQPHRKSRRKRNRGRRRRKRDDQQ